LVQQQSSPLNFNSHIQGINWSTATDLPGMPRHRWYFVKEAFSPTLVERAMELSECGSGDVVLDPFCGSGTSLIAAARKSAITVGCEVNPFLAFATRTKLTPGGHRSLAKHSATVKRGVVRGRKSPLEGNSTFTAHKGAKRWLFNTEVVRSFEGGWAKTETAHGPARNLMRLALIGAAMDCCNATQDGKCLRYRKEWEDENYGMEEFLDCFEKRLNQMRQDIEAAPMQGSTTKVIEGDCRKTLARATIPKFKLCVTSPPYLNSFDYSDIYRPEMYLGKFVGDTTALRAVRLRTLRSHVQASWEAPTEDDFSPVYVNSITALRERKDDLWDKRIPTMVQAYFEDMKLVLRSLKHHAQPKAQLWIVVSTSAYAGVEIPVDLIIADIAGEVGWRLHEIGVIRSLRSSGQHLRTVEGEHKKPLQLRESAVVLTAG
jgi:hypothetical protein